MKKKAAVIIILVFLTVMLFTACSVAAPGDDGGESNIETGFVASNERKIVYTVSLSLDCEDLSAFAELIEKSLEADEWTDSVVKRDTSATYKLRVKTARLDAFCDKMMDAVGGDNVWSYQKSATDISLKYYDKKGQIDALVTERTRLVELMENGATTVSDLILISTRLAEVDFELQKLRGELYEFDSFLEYSVVEIDVSEISYAWVVVLVVFLCIVVAVATVAFVRWRIKKKARA